MRQCCGQHHHQAVCLVLGVAYTVAINTDCQHLAVAEAGTKAFLGKKLTKSLGVGDPPEVERKAAESAKGLLEDVLKGANMAFRHSRRGGGTVTGAAPVVARIAMEQGYIVVGVGHHTLPCGEGQNAGGGRRHREHESQGRHHHHR